jgi:hypothetical protein
MKGVRFRGPTATQRWNKRRDQMVTGTLAARIGEFGPAMCKAARVAAGLDVAENLDWKPSVQRGVALEEPLAQWIATETGAAKVRDLGRTCIVISDVDPRFGASLDRILYYNNGFGQRGRKLAEIKTTNRDNRRFWMYGIPERVKLQMQWQMYVSGIHTGVAVVAFCNPSNGEIEERRSYELEYDPSVIAELMPKIEVYFAMVKGLKKMPRVASVEFVEEEVEFLS